MLDKIGTNRFKRIELVGSKEANEALSLQQKSEMKMAFDKKKGITTQECKIEINCDEKQEDNKTANKKPVVWQKMWSVEHNRCLFYAYKKIEPNWQAISKICYRQAPEELKEHFYDVLSIMSEIFEISDKFDQEKKCHSTRREKFFTYLY